MGQSELSKDSIWPVIGLTITEITQGEIFVKWAIILVGL